MHKREIIANDIAIISLSCYSPKFTDITSVWSNLLNQNLGESPYKPKKTNETIVENVITKVINDISPKLEPDHFQSIGIFTQQAFQLEAKEVLERLNIRSAISCNNINTSSNSLIHAIKSLNDNECDLAIIADFSISQTSEAGIAFVLKRWQKAVSDGTRSYAILKNLVSSWNSNDQLLCSYYEKEKIKTESINYLLLADEYCKSLSIPEELHQLFSNKETKANKLAVAQPIIDFYSESHLYLSLLQASLSLSNKLLPRKNPNTDETDGIQSPMFFQQKTRPWFNDTNSNNPRRAAVHLTRPQIHLVLEEISEFDPCAKPLELPLYWENETAVFSAESHTQLNNQLQHLLERIQKDSEITSPLDIAVYLARQIDYTSSYRLAIVYKDLEELSRLVQTAIDQISINTKTQINDNIYYAQVNLLEVRKLACIFPGLGFPGIVGRYSDNLFELCLRFPEVRQVFDLVELRDNCLADSYPTSHLFFPPNSYDKKTLGMLKQRLASPEYSDAQDMEIPDQKNLSSFGVAVANWSCWQLIKSLGIPVNMLFGQSQGELSALCASGKIDFYEFIKMHWETDIDPDYISDGGRLALVGSSEEKLQAVIVRYPSISIAVHIAPEFQILGGDEQEIQKCVEELQKESVWTQVLPYPAIHTPHFTSLRTRMEPELKHIEIYPSVLPVYSGLTGSLYPEDIELTRKGMIDNLDHPVLLWQTTRKMYGDGAKILLQAGGGATMYSQAKTNIGADDVITTSIDVDYRGPIAQLNHMCATLFTSGLTFDMETLYKNRKSIELTWDINDYSSNIIVDKDESALSVAHRKEKKPELAASINSTVHENDNSGTLPFAGDFLEYSEGRSLLVSYTLNLQEDLYLADHVFAYAWDVKPLRECLPVVPLTVSLEIMAEIAAYLAPNLGLIGFKGISASNWIALRESETLELKILAKLLSSENGICEVYVELTSEGRTHPDTKGIVQFSEQYQQNLVINLTPFTNTYSYPLATKEIYQTRKLFHGPMYHCISGETLIADQGVIGELTVLSKNQMFKTNANPFLMTDPLLLDAVGQLIGLWAMERKQYVFPISIDNIEIYTATPPVGSRVPVSIQIQNSTPHTLYLDIEIQDDNGNVWMRIKNWGDWIFKWPDEFADYRRFPQHYMMSEKFVINKDDSSSCIRILNSALVSTDMEETLARITLHSSEMEHYLHLIKYPKRAQQWLMGRLVAKEAVRDWLVQNNMPPQHPASIIIDSEKQGRPILRPTSDYVTPHISLSHTDKYIVAIAADTEVGIDIEAIQEHDDLFIKQFASTKEIYLLQKLICDPAESIIRLWSAKESFAKALGTGLPANPKLIRLEKISSDGSLFYLFNEPQRLKAKVKIWSTGKHIVSVTCKQQIKNADNPTLSADIKSNSSLR